MLNFYHGKMLAGEYMRISEQCFNNFLLAKQLNEHLVN